MNFSYQYESPEERPVYAYIDADGDLVLKSAGLGVAVTKDGHICHGINWRPNDPSTKVKFYKGDTVSITF